MLTRTLTTDPLLTVARTASAAARTSCPVGGPSLEVDLGTVTIQQLQRRMVEGTLTSFALTSAYLDRIRTLNDKVNAVLCTDPSALRQAADSDVRHRDGSTRGPLDGIPVLLKDNINTRDMPTTAGSLALAGEPPAADAALVTSLRDAGAVILGKTNLSEWANFRAESATSGWSAVGGQTHNPYVLDRTPCGSSAGSAVAVAASLSQVAIGTETDGSIVCPAGMNGVAGMKPTPGVVSGDGVVPISAEQDTPGPIARNVTDAALTLSVLEGSGSVSVPDAEALHGKRIGLWRLPSLGPRVDAVMDQTAMTFKGAGATVIDVRPPYQDQLAAREIPALLSEFHRDIDAYLATRRGPPDLAALIEFNRTHPAERSCFAGQELFEWALASLPTTDPRYQAQRAELRDLSRRSIDETVRTHELDSIAVPTNPPAWITDCARGDVNALPSATPAAAAGYPSISVPAGFVGELPIGVLFMVGRRQDRQLLSMTASAEHHLNAWRAPRFLSSEGP